MTAEQLRAARALLRWSARELAEKSGVALSTIARSEQASGAVPMIAANERVVRETLEAAGVEFIENGVRIRAKRPRSRRRPV